MEHFCPVNLLVTKTNRATCIGKLTGQWWTMADPHMVAHLTWTGNPPTNDRLGDGLHSETNAKDVD